MVKEQTKVAPTQIHHSCCLMVSLVVERTNGQFLMGWELHKEIPRLIDIEGVVYSYEKYDECGDNGKHFIVHYGRM